MKLEFKQTLSLDLNVFYCEGKPKAKGHYSLTVTQRMHVPKLREKLLWVADRMQRIQSRGKALWDELIDQL